jgi:hypothetical protein
MLAQFRESAQAMVTPVRALRRFLHVAGHVPVPLSAAVPAGLAGGWRHCPAAWTPRWRSFAPAAHI